MITEHRLKMLMRRWAQDAKCFRNNFKDHTEMGNTQLAACNRHAAYQTESMLAQLEDAIECDAKLAKLEAES